MSTSLTDCGTVDVKMAVLAPHNLVMLLIVHPSIASPSLLCLPLL